MAVIDLKNCTIKFKDGGSNFVEVKIGEGNLTYDEKVNREYIRDRGVLDTVRDGDEEPVDVRVDAQWEYVTGSSAATPEDAVKKAGQASAWVSTSDDPCEPYCIDIEVVNDPGCGGAGSETIVLSMFRYESISHDMKGGTISFTGKCNVTQATATRGGGS